MSSVVPINTQRYQSGDYTLEVTAHPSPLSQWSDRTVIRQLRFSLWVEQPDRQRLAAGNQQQLVELSQQVEAYVQTHLTQVEWPKTHRLRLLDQDLTLSTLQLFNLAEVLNAYGQTHITLPVTAKRRRSRWWTGSAAASLLVAVGVTTVYFQYRPAAWHEATTSQAPQIVEEEFDRSAALPETDPSPAAEPDDLSSRVEQSSVEQPDAQESQRLAQQPIEPEGNDSNPNRQPDIPTRADSPVDEGAPEPPQPEIIAESAPAPEPAAVPPAASPAPSDEEKVEAAADEFGGDSAASATAEADAPAAASSPELETSAAARMSGVNDEAILAAIASQFAPYQPADAPYPLVYRLQLSPEGSILNLEPVTDNAPTLEIPLETTLLAPGRVISVEITYTGAPQPTIRELSP